MKNTEYEKLTLQGTALSLQNENTDLIKNKLTTIDAIAEVVKNNLINDIDYMTIPRTNKPSLLKSGAQKIALTYGLIANYDILEKLSSKEMVKYMFKCILTNGNGLKVAEGFGLCSSLEPKFSKNKNNPFEIENTILKMAEKRAFVDAIVSIGNLSKVFTQDMEDIAKDIEILENRAKTERIDKSTAFELYNFFYSIFIINYEKLPFAQRKEEQEKVKLYIKEILKQVGNYANIYELTVDKVQTFKTQIVKYYEYITNVNKQVQESSFEEPKNWTINDEPINNSKEAFVTKDIAEDDDFLKFNPEW